MHTHSRRIGRAIAFGALSFALIAGPSTVAGGAAAQSAIVDPNAPKANLSTHDGALDAARRGDYVAALELSKKAAAEGHPLDADQVDFISGKAAKQQAAADETAKLKAKQQEASATAEQILTRQQKDYAARAKQATSQCDPPTHIGTFTSAAGAAGSQGPETFGGKRITGADDKCPG